MIKFNQLRSLNWITKAGKPIHVDLYRFWEIHEAAIKGYDWLEDCEGIFVTTEILKKCGFKNDHSTFEFADGSNNGKIFITWIQNEYVAEFGNGNKNIPVIIQYLHQLQNLYFALVGEELNISL